MNRPILLRHLSNSSLTGQARQFALPRIRLGRKSDNDVVFDPDLDRLVSGYHCEIIAQGDALYVVDPGSTNGTFVNGRRVQGKMPVTDRDQVTLGENGPTFAVAFAAGGAGSPMTIMGNVQQVGLSPANAQGLMASQGGGVAAPPKQSYSLEAPPAYPGQYSGPGPGSGGATSRPASRTSLGMLPKQGIGINTLMSELDKASKRERKRIMIFAAPAVAVLLLIVGLIWYFTRGDKPGGQLVNSVPTTGPSAVVTPEWAKTLNDRKTSIYLMVIRVPNREDTPFGTAWSVAKGVLATNAHVASLFNEVPPTATILARSNTTPPVDLKIDAVDIHPGYTEWKRYLAAYAPLDANTGNPISYPMNYDVALMTVAPADVEKQAKPLELADPKTLASLTEASEVASMGFPMEGSAEGGVNTKAPEPHRFIGIISRKTDIFLSAGNEARSNFLQYTIQVQGGSSGSPVFNREGKVIGLIAGNDVVGEGTGGARIMISGKSFGPRAEAVQELLDKVADAKLQPVAKEWRATLREKFEKAYAAKKYEIFPDDRALVSYNIIRQNREKRGERWLGKPVVRLEKKYQVSTTELAASAGVKSFSVPVDQPGYYVVVVGTDNPNMTPKIELPTELESKIQQKPKPELAKIQEWIGYGRPFTACHPVRKDPGETVDFVISAVPNEPGNTATFTATVYKAPP